MIRGALAFILSFGFWTLFTWPPDWQTISVGTVVAIIAALLFGRMIQIGRVEQALNPIRYLWGIWYIIVVIYYIILANFDVAYRVLHPEMPIKPGLVKVRTTLESDIAKTILANSITLTPGTLSVDISSDGYLYVHWINVKAKDVKGATSYVAGRFEGILRRIFK